MRAMYVALIDAIDILFANADMTIGRAVSRCPVTALLTIGMCGTLTPWPVQIKLS